MLNPADEKLLGEILTGLRREDEPEVARRLAASPELAAELAELRSMQAGLDELGDEVHLALAAASESADDAREAELVARTLGGLPLPIRAAAGGRHEDDGADLPRLADQRGGVRPSPPRTLRLLAALAAAAIVLWFGAGLMLGGDERPADVMLGGEFEIEAIFAEEHAVNPIGFEWESVAGAAGSYDVAIYPRDGTEPVLRAMLTEPQWILEPDQLSRLPEDFRLEVHGLSVGGGASLAGWLEFRSSSR
ncbi:hypothetical protein [Engelhardtia mirabilis]|uniref:Anti-sigma-K factor rskA n=1 Tax=Engelhardtia mirabilis TaxID=2528011 RepID=A0A518BEK7_9BACT|nr:hypothetical protein Pla133_04830 [Planctomycetes bacterium Pla133]QDU99744.1 hypothetical protein Pla86_04830 [Planctomycetes bacterium Pla86]